MTRASIVDKIALKDGEGLGCGCRARARRAGDGLQREVRHHHGKRRIGEHLAKKLGTVIKIMVAKGDRIDPDCLHRADDRMIAARLALALADIGDDGIAHRVAMQKIAVVEQ